MPAEMNRRKMLCMTTAGLTFGIASAASGQQPSEPTRIGVIGTGARGTDLLKLLLAAGVEVVALCDIDRGSARQCHRYWWRRPETAVNRPATPTVPRTICGCSNAMTWRRSLSPSPIQLHATMAIDAMRAGKHVLSRSRPPPDARRVLGAGSRNRGDRQALHARRELLLLRLCDDDSQHRQTGAFRRADLCRVRIRTRLPCPVVQGRRSLTWRGELARDYAGNWYPTHSLGPVAQWLGINRGDRLVSLVAGCTGQSSLRDYVNR